MNNGPEMLYGDIPFYAATNEPCIVCGHTNGNCTGSSTDEVRIFGVHHSSVATSDDAKILVEEDIVEETQITPFTRAKVLVARKGSYVTVARAKELGII